MAKGHVYNDYYSDEWARDQEVIDEFMTGGNGECDVICEHGESEQHCAQPCQRCGYVCYAHEYGECPREKKRY